MNAPITSATLYTRKQTAALLGVTPRTLSVWARQGRGPAYSRSGAMRGRVWYTPADVMAWIETRKAGGKAATRPDETCRPPYGGTADCACDENP